MVRAAGFQYRRWAYASAYRAQGERVTPLPCLYASKHGQTSGSLIRSDRARVLLLPAVTR